jgi:cytidine deaminase
MTSVSQESLLEAAWSARENACAKYSHFQVGAALETLDGRIFTGCNVESSSYGLTCCAERIAVFKALSEGHREFRRIAIVTGAKVVCPPCGACRQILADYAPKVEVILANREEVIVTPFADLFPFHFNHEFLEKA